MKHNKPKPGISLEELARRAAGSTNKKLAGSHQRAVLREMHDSLLGIIDKLQGPQMYLDGLAVFAPRTGNDAPPRAANQMAQIERELSKVVTSLDDLMSELIHG